MMARLVNCPPPPPLTRWEQWRRSLNKKLGWPATPDVGILADMLAKLRDAAGSAAGGAPDHVAVSRPPINCLRDEDIWDALEHAGLRPWLDFNDIPEAGMYPTSLSEAHAVFAAGGQGLCKNYKDLFECWEEEERMPWYITLLVGFTQKDLRAEIVAIRAPFYWYQGVWEKFADFDAGLDGMANFTSEEAFWEHVRGRIAGIVVSIAPLRIAKLVLAGENATDPRFLRALTDALVGAGYIVSDAEGGGEGSLLLAVEEGDRDTLAEPIFATARGAAQYSRWRQEAPIGCRERKECEGRRDKERANQKDGSWQLGAERVELR